MWQYSYMRERLSSSNPQNQESRGQRRWRHFVHYYGAAFIMALGLLEGGSMGLAESQRIIQGDFGKITDHQQMEAIRSGDYRAAINPDNKPPLPNQTGGWLLDAFLVSGFAAGLVVVGYGTHLRIITRDR